ncbi:PREDICTED: transmembrane and TPR repeat-containing protein 2-like, partial [Rhagoletis zephyria]|uniref:transmembrane and TPR repeat-containing protein 2-like n=1 Tax=Rhagoletis zephyria TaxID=28612 RepID=UPI000811475E
MQLIRNLLSNVCCPSFSAQQKSLKKHLKNNGEPQNHIGNTFYQAKRPPQLSPPPSPPPPPNCHQTSITPLERLLLLSLTTALYLNSLPADFAYDDTRAITANDDLRPETPWSALLLHDYWGTPIGSSNSHGSYRPVTVATFRLNYLLHGLRPLGYHLGNLLLHGLVTALYTTVLQAAAVHRRVTLLSGLLFAAHPIHVEAVSSVVGRADLLAGAFYLASLNAYVRFVNHAPTNNNFTTTAFTAAQLSSKQKNTQQTTPTPKVQPSHYHSPLSSASSTVLCRLDCLSFSLALTIIPFLPASNLFFYVGFVIAERILYIPSFGYCLLLAVGTRFTVANRRQSNNSKTAAIIYASTTVLLVAFSLRTVLRNVDWLTEENLYRSGVAVNPPKALGNLGNILKAQGRIEEAEAAYRAALRHRPNMADVHYNLGLLLQESPGGEGGGK